MTELFTDEELYGGLSGQELDALIAKRENTISATARQEGGAHYAFQSIQPIDYIYENNMGYMEGNVIKYVTRHRYKNGAEDLRKAIHYLEMLLEKEYP